MKSQSATAMIREDHRKVDHLYQQYSSFNGQNNSKQALAEQICHELEVHAQLEESIFYPALQAKLGSRGQKLVSEALKEHGDIKQLIHQFRMYATDATEGDKILNTLMQGVKHHVREEESDMLPEADEHLRDELGRLGKEMEKKKQQLTVSAQPNGKTQRGKLADRITATNKDTSEASNIEQAIDVDVPVHTAYNQWTQFEEFPKFMDGVEQVTQLDDTHIHWKATIGGVTKEWDAVITEQLPDKRIAWTNISGTRNAGVVTFHRLTDHQTRIMLQLDYEPEGFIENVGDMIGLVSMRVSGDLQRFKDFIEARRQETGAWRGEVSHPHN